MIAYPTTQSYIDVLIAKVEALTDENQSMIDRKNLPQTGGGLSRMVERLVRDTTLQYSEIVAKVREEFPEANTSTKSVASVACVMRKKGVAVPLRLRLIA